MGQPKQLKPLKRKIVIAGETWTYQIGNYFAVVMNPEQTKKTTVHISEMGGQAGERWYAESIPVTPALVAEWIRKHGKEQQNGNV